MVCSRSSCAYGLRNACSSRYPYSRPSAPYPAANANGMPLWRRISATGKDFVPATSISSCAVQQVHAAADTRRGRAGSAQAGGISAISSKPSRTGLRAPDRLGIAEKCFDVPETETSMDTPSERRMLVAAKIVSAPSARKFQDVAERRLAVRRGGLDLGGSRDIAVADKGKQSLRHLFRART